jgi:RimJ/RimL family protein N-acetyltransferase
MVLGGQPPGRVGSRRFFSVHRGGRFGGLYLWSMNLREGNLELRPWTLDDVPAIVAACNDHEIQHWIPVIPRPYSDADAEAFVRGEVARTGEQNFAVTEEGRVVGSIGMIVNDSRTGAIGYWCAREARGRGVTTRALRLICEYGLHELQLERLELLTDTENFASQRVAEKVGFQREGVLRSHLVHPDGRRRDSVMFSLLPGELR